MSVDLQCFKDSALSFLNQEIDNSEKASAIMGGLSFVSNTLGLKGANKLLDKLPKGSVAKSVRSQLADFEALTTTVTSSVENLVNFGLQDIFTLYEGDDPATGITGTAYKYLMSVLTTNSNFTYSMSKRASRAVSNASKNRVALSGEIIKTIGEIRTVRQDIPNNTGALAKAPNEAAEAVAADLKAAKSLMGSTATRIQANRLDRTVATYNRSVEYMSSALDGLKIGSGSFRLSEYFRLRTNLKIAIDKYTEIDLEVSNGIGYFENSESDFDAGKEQVGSIESEYLRQILNRLSALIENIEKTLEKENEDLTLELFQEWTEELLAIYTLSHTVFDQEVIQSTGNPENENKQKYDQLKTALSSYKSQIQNDLKFISDLIKLPDLYTLYIKGKISDSELRAIESTLIARLQEVSAADQQYVADEAVFNPIEEELLGFVLASARRAGLDNVTNSIIRGDIGTLFGSLTAELGASASQAAACLGKDLDLIPNLETRAALLDINTSVQNVFRNRQLAGAVRENAFKGAKNNVDRTINQLKAKVESLNAFDPTKF
jgi:hypothetical protein